MIYEPAHPDTLALYCSDGRFTRAVEELCGTLGADRIDTVTLPGGPGLLDHGKLSLFDTHVVAHALEFLIVGHDIKRIVLVAHAGCGYYRSHYPTADGLTVIDRQRVDLRYAAVRIKQIRNVEVTCFFARIDNGHIVFEPV